MDDKRTLTGQYALSPSLVVAGETLCGCMDTLDLLATTVQNTIVNRTLSVSNESLCGQNEPLQQNVVTLNKVAHLSTSWGRLGSSGQKQRVALNRPIASSNVQGFAYTTHG